MKLLDTFPLWELAEKEEDENISNRGKEFHRSASL